MFDREGRMELEWLDGREMLMKAEGYPSDMVKALTLGLRKVVADRMRQGRGAKTAHSGHRAPESAMERRSMEVTVG